MLSRYVFWFVSMLSILPVGLLTGCSESGDEAEQVSTQVARPVKTVIVQPVNAALKRTYPAIVLPSQQAELSFRVSGRIVELPVRAAMRVKKGDVIASLDTRDFEAEISRLESQLGQEKAKLNAMTSGARSEDLASLQANVDAARAQLVAARKQVERLRRLVKKGSVAQVDLDNEIAKLSAAEAQFKVSKQDLAKGQAGSRGEEVEAQEAIIRGLETQISSAKDNLSDATLRAPFDGIVAQREVDNFANIQAKAVVVVMQKLNVLDMQFDVPGPDVTRLAANKGSRLSATLDNLPDVALDAAFVEFSTQADPATQTYRGRVSIKPPKGAVVLPGMTGSIIITPEVQEAAAVYVPATALASEPNGQSFVWVVKKPENTVQKRTVRIGEAVGVSIAVLEGLRFGERVVTAGVSYLQEAMPVKPIAAVGD